MRNERTFFDADELIDEVLKTEPGCILSDGFVDELAEKVERRFAWQQYLKEFLIYLGVIVGILMVSAGMALIWYDANWREWGQFMLNNAGILMGVNVLVVFILFADRVLLRYFLFKASTN